MELVENKQVVDEVTKRVNDKYPHLSLPRSLVYYIIRMVEFFVAKEISKQRGFIMLSQKTFEVKMIVPNWREKVKNGEVSYKIKDFYSKAERQALRDNSRLQKNSLLSDKEEVTD